jgi:hypothetical protein
MITFKHKGDFEKTKKFFWQTKRINYTAILERYGMIGLRALESATPKDTGVAASAWSYKVSQTSRGYSIQWSNDDRTPEGTPIVILLQYGHGTNGGGYVQGQDFINPAIKPIFDDLSNRLREEVS